MLHDDADYIKFHGCACEVWQHEERGARLIRSLAQTIFQIGVDSGKVEPVIYRQQDESHDNVAENEAETGLHVGHVREQYHAGNRDEGNARDRSSYHAEGYNIPFRFAPGSEKRLVVGFTCRKATDSEEYRKIDGYG